MLCASNDLCCGSASSRASRSAVARLSIAVQIEAIWPRSKTTFRRSTTSAGISAYRKGARGLEVLLVHPGGPFWRNKDAGAWSIPKGEIDAADAPEQVALRGLPKNSARALQLVHSGRWGRSDSAEASGLSHSPARAILIRRH